LFYVKENTLDNFRGSLELSWSKITFEELEDDSKIASGFNWRMSIVKNKKYTDLFIDSQEKLERVKEVLKPLCINGGFYDDFEVIKKIGSGAFASVSFDQHYFFSLLLWPYSKMGDFSFVFKHQNQGV
jgi:hypothetical protein